MHSKSVCASSLRDWWAVWFARQGTTCVAAFLAAAVGLATFNASNVSAADFKVGDVVVTAQDRTDLGFKERTVKELGRGIEIIITEVRDPWIGGYVEQDGERFSGWVHKREVRRAAVKPTDLPEVTDEKSAVAALEKFGVTVELDGEDHVQVLDATDTGITDANLSWFAHLPNLTIVQLGGTAITDDGLAALKDKASVEMLYLDRCDITDKGLEHLSGLTNLQVLVMENTLVTGEGLEKLTPLTELRTLNLARCSLTDEQLKSLTKLTNLEVVTLIRTGLKGDGLAHLRPLEKLRVLNISYNPMSEESLTHLYGAPTLKMLYVRGIRTTEDSIRALKDTLVSCAVYR